MPHIFFQYYKSTFGELIIGSYENKLCLCDWRYRKMREVIDKRLQKGLNAQYKEETTPIIKETIQQLDAYSQKKHYSFDIPLLFVGTEFQKKVWQALLMIPYGQTNTYLQLSQQLGNEKAIRAVASANGANAISIIVPCHRIIGSDGKLTGYAGGLAAKQKLLTLEGYSKQASQLTIF
ncbi:methylated-DNA--[protein]-cysteine S-methyltransferase [Carboxylicivirga marina]|uniref:Methylated-DNA--protein-cysteine methyltransferase n=1 Tax=Carboxylicivirga marina TaxID=2800988 RepID=A0ABS1HFK1_9BACT|nr:methylated-DNA--[protein]-cysteine S-methyltransferase [Carboxylicivirga marina]MBK3516441.1 methylated-DNA--[protein]-cysteine S-methyltransferase [Carboxylicivirga marina]